MYVPNIFVEITFGTDANTFIQNVINDYEYPNEAYISFLVETIALFSIIQPYNSIILVLTYSIEVHPFERY